MTSTATSNLPVIRILTTGGTIAGRITDADNPASYQAGALSAGDLMASVPGLASLAQCDVEPVLNLDSAAITAADWLTLLAATLRAIAEPSVAGVVITHGTDSMEETSFWLHVALADLAPHNTKPIVFVGAMRPANAVSAEGPANLLAAVATATHPAAAGVSVVMNESIFDPWSVAKSHTYRVDAFTGGEHGVRGYVAGGQVQLLRAAAGGAAVASLSAAAVAAVRNYWGLAPLAAAPERLAAVPLVTLHVGFDPELLTHVATSAQGLVIAGFGNGNFGAPVLEAVTEIARRLPVIRASRVPHGAVIRNGAIDDAAAGLLTLDDLSPLKARALLSWVLAGS